MSARLTPDELKRIAPEVYAREFESPPKRKQAPRRERRRSPTTIAAWIFTAAAVIFQTLLTLYIILNY